MKLYFGILTAEGASKIGRPELAGRVVVFTIVKGPTGLTAINLCHKGKVVGVALPLDCFSQRNALSPDNGGIMSNLISWFKPMSTADVLGGAKTEPPPKPVAAPPSLPPPPAPKPIRKGIPEPRDVRLYGGHPMTVNALAVFDRDRTVVIGGMADELRLVELTGGSFKRNETMTNQGKAWALAASPDGKHYASTHDQGRIVVRNIWVRTPVATALCGNSFTRRVSWAPDGRHLALANDATFWVWDPLTEKFPVPHQSRHKDACSASWAPDSIRVAVAGATGVAVYRHDGMLTANGKWFDQSIDGTVVDALWSPGSPVIAIAFAGGGLRLWDTSIDKEYRLTGHNKRIRSMLWSPDGRTLVTGGDDSAIRFWDGAGDNLHPLRVMPGFQEPVRALAQFNDGEKLLVSTNQRSGVPSHHLALYDFDAPNFGRVD